MFCRMTNKISYKIAAFLRVFTHKMAVWKFCLQDGGVSESFFRKMAAWKICLQDGSVSESFTRKAAFR